jgi:hypothetical protein
MSAKLRVSWRNTEAGLTRCLDTKVGTKLARYVIHPLDTNVALTFSFAGCSKDRTIECRVQDACFYGMGRGRQDRWWCVHWAWCAFDSYHQEHEAGSRRYSIVTPPEPKLIFFPTASWLECWWSTTSPFMWMQLLAFTSQQGSRFNSSTCVESLRNSADVVVWMAFWWTSNIFHCLSSAYHIFCSDLLKICFMIIA